MTSRLVFLFGARDIMLKRALKEFLQVLKSTEVFFGDFKRELKREIKRELKGELNREPKYEFKRELKREFKQKL